MNRNNRREGDPRPPRVHLAAELLTGFPGPVAIALGSVGGATPVLAAEEIDGLPWAIEVGYTVPGRHLLTIRTVRSPAGLDPRGLTLESLASAVVNFLAADESARSAGPPSPDESQSMIVTRIAASRVTREQVGRTPTRPATVDVGGVAVPGARVDLAGCSAVDLRWDNQTVYCVGTPDVIDELRLRPATPGDFDEQPQPA